jgi:DNA-directed RNA polymerase subunit beta'
LSQEILHHPLSERVLGRTPCEDLNDNDNQIIVKAGEIIEEKHLDKIVNSGLRSLKIRSVLTCETENGICLNVMVETWHVELQ